MQTARIPFRNGKGNHGYVFLLSTELKGSEVHGYDNTANWYPNMDICLLICLYNIITAIGALLYQYMVN